MKSAEEETSVPRFTEEYLKNYGLCVAYAKIEAN
jgi:hypothetical protein